MDEEKLKRNKISGKLNESERLELARLLIKAGYSVRVGSGKPEGKPNGVSAYFVEYWKEEKAK